MNPIPPLGKVLETGLYVNNMVQAREFYESVMGLVPTMADARLTAYAAGSGSVLLLFQRGTTDRPAATPGGSIPGHDGAGRLHYAFSIAEEDLPAWREHLARRKIRVESEVSWPKGATSVYFRDPDRNLAELATPGLWDNY